MISFVWSSKYPFTAGSGGSENYTAGQIRELIRRGIPARIVTIGHGEQDGRDDFPDIPFLALESKEQLSELDDLIVYIIYPLDVRTRYQPYAVLHCPPPAYQHGDPLYVRRAFDGVKLITASKFAAGLWRRYLKTKLQRMPTVYPFADQAFRDIVRPKRPTNEPVRILFGGRLKADKGIYTLLSALHMENLEGMDIRITATTSGKNTEEGATILKLLRAHPLIDVIPARKTAAEMAQLMAEHDIVVMPSSNIFWQELFGMVSIEAQQAGCRVVASRSGGLPETQIGGVLLVRPDDPKALASGIAAAIARGPLTATERQKACRQFSVKQSVDSLLKAVDYQTYVLKLSKQLRAEVPSSTATARRRTLLPRGAEALPHLLSGRLQPGLMMHAAAGRQPASPVRGLKPPNSPGGSRVHK